MPAGRRGKLATAYQSRSYFFTTYSSGSMFHTHKSLEEDCKEPRGLDASKRQASEGSLISMAS